MTEPDVETTVSSAPATTTVTGPVTTAAPKKPTKWRPPSSGRLGRARDMVQTRNEPLLKDPTGRMEAIRAPPTEAYRALAAAGVMPTEGPRLHQAWCLCTHQEAAHPGGGPCQAKACRKFGGCQAYRQDPKYLLVGPKSGMIAGVGRIVESPGETPGTVRLHFDRNAPLPPVVNP